MMHGWDRDMSLVSAREALNDGVLTCSCWPTAEDLFSDGDCDQAQEQQELQHRYARVLACVLVALQTTCSKHLPMQVAANARLFTLQACL